jgi:hypothetical protein
VPTASAFFVTVTLATALLTTSAAFGIPNCPPGTHVVNDKPKEPGGRCEPDADASAPVAAPVSAPVAPSVAASAAPIKSATPAASAVPTTPSAPRPTTGGCQLVAARASGSGRDTTFAGVGMVGLAVALTFARRRTRVVRCRPGRAP